MKIYILTMRGYGQKHIVGVYDSRQAAETVKDSVEHNEEGVWGKHYGEITEHELQTGQDSE